MNPIHPAHARELMEKGKAAVFRRFPFTLIMKRVVDNTALSSNMQYVISSERGEGGAGSWERLYFTIQESAVSSPIHSQFASIQVASKRIGGKLNDFKLLHAKDSYSYA